MAFAVTDRLPEAWLLSRRVSLLDLMGDVLWGAYELAGRDPARRSADAFYLAGYPLVAAGMVVGIRHRSPTGTCDR